MVWLQLVLARAGLRNVQALSGRLRVARLSFGEALSALPNHAALGTGLTEESVSMAGRFLVTRDAHTLLFAIATRTALYGLLSRMKSSLR